MNELEKRNEDLKNKIDEVENMSPLARMKKKNAAGGKAEEK